MMGKMMALAPSNRRMPMKSPRGVGTGSSKRPTCGESASVSQRVCTAEQQQPAPRAALDRGARTP
jgi:hypothetical protein